MKVKGLNFFPIVLAILVAANLRIATAAEASCLEGEVLGFLLEEAYVYESAAATEPSELTFEQVKEKNGGNPILVCGMTPDNLVEVEASEVKGKRLWIEAGDVEFDRPIAKFAVTDCRQRNTLSEAASAGAVKCP